MKMPTQSLALWAIISVLGLGILAQGATKGDSLPKAVGGSVLVLTATATAIPTNDMIGRNSIAIFNNGPNTIWCGWKSTVSTTNGFPVAAQSSLNMDVVADAQGTPKLYCIASAADQVSPADTRYMEVK